MTFVDVGSRESRDTWYVLLLEKRWITNYTWLRSLLNLLRKVSEPIFRVQILQSCGEESFTTFRSVLCQILDLFLNYVICTTKSVIHVFFFCLTCTVVETKWSWFVLIYDLLVNWRYGHFLNDIPLNTNFKSWFSRLAVDSQDSSIRSSYDSLTQKDRDRLSWDNRLKTFFTTLKN